MSVFRFRLETLLKLRESDRRQRQVELAEAYRAEQVLREQMDGLAAELAGHKERVRAASAGNTVDVNELLDMNRYELILKTQSAALGQQTAQIQEEVEKRRGLVVAADREVRVLENLRERRLAAHQLAEAQREMKELDEISQQQTRRERR